MATNLSLEHREKPDFVVVCVCTKDRPAMFRRCLNSLLRQRFSNKRLSVHVLVVDNSEFGGERDLVAQYQPGPVPITYVHQPKPGIPLARNAALDAVAPLSPDWVAFIDDDEIAPPDWIAHLHAAALHCDGDVVSGRVNQYTTSEEAVAGAENWSPPPTFGKSRRLPTCATSNVIFRGNLISGDAGLRFDESMRHGGSDTEFFMRATQLGARIFGIEDAFVFEEYPAERRTLVYECMRSFRVGASTNYRFRKNYGNFRGLYFLAGRVSSKSFSAFTSILVGFFTFPISRPLGKRRFKRGMCNAATAFGCIGPMIGLTPNRYW